MVHFLFPRPFYAFFWTSFSSVISNNIFKNAFSILIVYEFASQDSSNSKILLCWAAFLYLFPFLLFTGLGGALADKYSKTQVLRHLKAVEFFIVCLGGLGLALHNLYILLFTLAALATSAAFFGPAKYAIIPQLIPKPKLLKANAVISGGNFVGILGGTIVGTSLALVPCGPWILWGILGLSSLSGYLSSFKIPRVTGHNEALPLRLNPFVQLVTALRHLWAHPPLYGPVAGIAWFWFMGVILTTQIPAFVKERLGAPPLITTLLLIIFTIGISAGGWLSTYRLAARLEGYKRALTLGLLGLSYATFCGASYYYGGTFPVLSIPDFLNPSGFCIMGALFCISLLGGFWVVPCQTRVQQDAPLRQRARLLGAGGILNAGVMVMATLWMNVWFYQEMSLLGLFLILGILNLLLGVGLLFVHKRR